MAMNPNNVKFVKGRAAHLKEHFGNWLNKTTGPLIDRLSQLSGPALLAFFLAYDEKMQELTEECAVCSNPDSWTANFNPFNWLVENAALTYGYAAARSIEDRDSYRDDDANTLYDVDY